jgi:prepilin-type N-terminal cleavage/methylation domain-containing protein
MTDIKKGFSLIEVVVSSSILAVLAAGVLSVTMMTSRVAYSNVYENTAHTVAQGYAEQIKTIAYVELQRALDDPSSHSIPTESLALGAGLSAADLKVSDPLIFGVEVPKEVIVDVEKGEDGKYKERIMNMWFTVHGNEIASSADCWDAMEIRIDYEWEVAGVGGLKKRSGQVNLVKSTILEL